MDSPVDAAVADCRKTAPAAVSGHGVGPVGTSGNEEDPGAAQRDRQSASHSVFPVDPLEAAVGVEADYAAVAAGFATAGSGMYGGGVGGATRRSGCAGDVCDFEYEPPCGSRNSAVGAVCSRFARDSGYRQLCTGGRGGDDRV